MGLRGSVVGGVGSVAIAALYERFFERDIANLDVDAAVAAYPDAAAMEARSRAAHQPHLVEEVVVQTMAKHLTPEQLRLLQRVHLDFVRAGAQLGEAQRLRYGAVVQELATLCTQFTQNVLADEAGFALELQGEADLTGLPAFLRESARSAAQQRGWGLFNLIDLPPWLAGIAAQIAQDQVIAAKALRLAPHYSTLLKLNTADGGSLVGDLARSWTVSADGRTLSFKLQPQVQFHNGTPLTSAA